MCISPDVYSAPMAAPLSVDSHVGELLRYKANIKSFLIRALTVKRGKRADKDKAGKNKK